MELNQMTNDSRARPKSERTRSQLDRVESIPSGLPSLAAFALPFAFVLLCTGVSTPASALIAPVTSITANGISGSGSILLTSVTLGSETVPVSALAIGSSSGVFQGSGTPLFPVENADNFNITSFASRFDPHDVVFFGGVPFRDTNGTAFDFVIFENGGNDAGTLQAIFLDDSIGQPVSFGNTAAYWGDTGFTSNVGNQPIKGMTFALTDLLDAAGTPLPASSTIKGIRISSAGLDPSTIAAVVVPEPTALILLGSGCLGLALAARRS
jgi:hypothetical protein